MITIACHWWNNSVFWIRTVSMFMEYSALDPTEGHILHFIDETQWERLKFTQQISSTLQTRSQRFLHLVICSFYHLQFSFSAMVFEALQVWKQSDGYILACVGFIIFSTESKSQFPGKPSVAGKPGWLVTYFVFSLCLCLLLTHTLMG